MRDTDLWDFLLLLLALFSENRGKTLHPINTPISSATIINAKQGFEGSLISRNVELSPQKPLKWSSDLHGWSVAEQYIDRARSESRLCNI